MTDIVFRNDSGVAVTTSMMVAEVFGKAHKNVLRDIDTLGCSDGFLELNFERKLKIRELASGHKIEDRYYTITRDGFTILAMGYTGKKAMAFKEQYIAAFNAMEQTIRGGLQQSINALTKKQIAQMLLSSEEEKEELMQRVMDTEAELDAVKTDLAARVLRLEQQRTPIATQQVQSQSVSIDLYPHEGVVSSYKTLRILHPDFVTVDRASQLLHERGVRIHKRSLYTFLEKEDYLSTEERTYHRPSRECVESGWMVCTSSGGTERYPRRKYHTPHLSPAFLDILEEQLRNIRR